MYCCFYYDVFENAVPTNHSCIDLLTTVNYDLCLSYFQCKVRLKRLIIYCFTSRLRIFHLYGDVTITGEGLQNLGLCSALRAFEQGGIFIVPYLL